MNENELLQLIVQASNIRSITPAMLDLLALVGQRAVHEAGQPLFGRDTGARSAYVVLEGVVEVAVGEHRSLRAVRHAWPGDIVRATEGDSMRRVIATARTRVESLRLPSAVFPTLSRHDARTFGLRN